MENTLIRSLARTETPSLAGPLAPHVTSQVQTMIMNQIISNAPVPPLKTDAAPGATFTDVTRGARRVGIHARVQLDSSLLENYSEPDRRLGLNTAGVVLSVLSAYLKAGNASTPNNVLTACLIRCADRALLDVDISVRRFRSGGEECFSLRKLTEREAHGETDALPDRGLTLPPLRVFR